MAHVIKVRHTDWKKSKLYGGNGKVAINMIHATQYAQPFEDLRTFCDELERDNPGFTFTPHALSERMSIV